MFSDLLEHKRRREAYQLAGGAGRRCSCVGLGLITLVFILLAPVVVPLFTGDDFTPALDDLCVGRQQVLFPIVVLLGLTGLAVGILNAHDHFTIPAIAPLVWNLVIIAGMVGLAPLFEGDNRLYAYAIGVLLGTLVQLADDVPGAAPDRLPGLPLPLPNRDDERVRRVLILMLPVSVGLGLININLLLNSTIGSIMSDEAPRAIDAAFRIYMLPQGMFSRRGGDGAVPAAHPARGAPDYAGLRAMTGVGMRQIALLLIPSAAAMLVLASRWCGFVSTSAGSSTRTPRS